MGHLWHYLAYDFAASELVLYNYKIVNQPRNI